MDPSAPRATSQPSIATVVGATAATVATGAMLALGSIMEQPTLAETVAEAIAAHTPVELIEEMVTRFGGAAKAMLFGTVLLGQIGVGAALGIAYGRWDLPRLRSIAVLVLAAAVVGLGLLPLLGAGVLGATSRAGAGATAASLAVLTGTFGLALAGLWAALNPTGTFAVEEAASRRAFLGKALLAIGGAVAGIGIFRWVADKLTPPPVPPTVSSEVLRTRAGVASAASLVEAIEAGVPGVSPEVTPNDKFYTVSKNVFRDPSVDRAAWQLRITGHVDRPLTLTYDEMRAFPAASQYFTLVCISNEVGGDLIGNAAWGGVRLGYLLRQAGVKPGAVDAIVRAADDYADSIPIEKALQDGTMLAYEMNGVPLPKKHGFPARLLMPDIYGMKNVKWVREIEVVEYDFKGYWQTRGWSDVATINTTARIDVPKNGSFLRSGPNYVGGIAVAGQRGIEQVEVSTDGGRTWSLAVMKPALGPNAWSLWLHRWDVPATEEGFKLLVRATDGAGAVQSAIVRETLPDGATGYHAVTVRRAEA